jgi:hypothetical protein
VVAAVLSLPMTFAAMPWIADHGFPHNPDKDPDVFRGGFGLCALVALIKGEVGSEVILRRDLAATPGFDVGVGDAFLEAKREPVLLAASSLASAVYMSSSTDMSLLVRGRRVELLLDVDNEDPLAGFMAWGHQAERMKVELHKPKECRDQ